jgi:hypothetical protein
VNHIEGKSTPEQREKINDYHIIIREKDHFYDIACP